MLAWVAHCIFLFFSFCCLFSYCQVYCTLYSGMQFVYIDSCIVFRLPFRNKMLILILKIYFLILFFTLLLYILYEKVPYTCYMSTGYNTRYTIHHLSKYVNNFYSKQFTTVTTHKNVQNYYNEKWTFNVNTYCNFLYPLKIWNCLNFIRKRRLIFLLN